MTPCKLEYRFYRLGAACCLCLKANPKVLCLFLDYYEQGSSNVLRNVLYVRQPHSVISQNTYIIVIIIIIIIIIITVKTSNCPQVIPFLGAQNGIVKIYYWLRHACLSIWLLVCLSVCLSVRPSVHPSA